MELDQPGGSRTRVVEHDWFRVGRVVFHIVQTVVVLVLLALGGAGLGFGVQPLPQVSPIARNSDSGVLVATLDPTATWLPLLGTTLVGLALCTPLVDRRPRCYRLGLLLGACYWATVTVLYAVVMADLRSGGARPAERGCLYEDCWPAGIQQTLLAAPVLPTFVAMVLMGTVFAGRHWVARMLIPPAVFAIAVAVQTVTWEPLVIPLLQSPP